MNDRDKVINVLSKYKKHAFGDKGEKVTVEEIIALLKAQEPVKPYAEYSEHTGTKWLTCGACNQPMIKMAPDAVYPNYCPECGRKVWWE